MGNRPPRDSRASAQVSCCFAAESRGNTGPHFSPNQRLDSLSFSLPPPTQTGPGEANRLELVLRPGVFEPAEPERIALRSKPLSSRSSGGRAGSRAGDPPPRLWAGPLCLFPRRGGAGGVARLRLQGPARRRSSVSAHSHLRHVESRCPAWRGRRFHTRPAPRRWRRRFAPGALV